ncbi:MAG: hypothetical protein ABSF33_06910 [Acidimicrobiales bacterium]|jgi:hypothetical protein
MSSIELGVICFGGFVLVLLVVVRAKRSHDRKIRRAASAGFYDFDAAHYGPAGGSSMEKAMEENRRPLAPSFSAAARGAGDTGGRTTSVGPKAPMPVPSSFGVIDRSPIGAPPAFDGKAAARERPLPRTPPIPPPPGSESDPNDPPLPLLVQPPPPPSGPRT